MSTVSALRPAVIPAGFEAHPCYMCEAVILVRSDTHESPICRDCERSNAEREAARLLDDVRCLIAGTGVYEILTWEERREQLLSLGVLIEPARTDVDAPDAATRDQIESEDEAAELVADRWDGLS